MHRSHIVLYNGQVYNENKPHVFDGWFNFFLLTVPQASYSTQSGFSTLSEREKKHAGNAVHPPPCGFQFETISSTYPQALFIPESL